MKEQIQKWEEEIERIAERQREMVEKNNARIRDLRKKIQEAETQIALENNRMIAETVRDIYGDVSAENLDAFRQLLSASVESRKGQ